MKYLFVALACASLTFGTESIFEDELASAEGSGDGNHLA
jgi:hypothetical protein